MRLFIIGTGVAVALLNLAWGQSGGPEPAANEVTSQWRPGRRGPVIEVTESAGGIVGTFVRNGRYAIRYELTRLADGTFKGFAAEEFSCRPDHFCRIETPMHATRVGEHRIEGRIFGVMPPRGLARGNRYCDTCGKSEAHNARWMQFVWVREP